MDILKATCFNTSPKSLEVSSVLQHKDDIQLRFKNNPSPNMQENIVINEITYINSRTINTAISVLTCTCFSTFFWFSDCIIFIFFFGFQANSAAARGDGVETELYSSRARNLVIITLSVGLIIISISIIVRTTSGTY